LSKNFGNISVINNNY